MSSAELSSSEDLVVGLDHGQFYLRTSEEDPELAVDLLGDDEGIAQQGGLVVVESPHQNNFEMPLRLEVWTGQPDDDLDDWEEAFEVHLDVGGDGLMYESPTLNVVSLSVPPGSYHAIISGRGFVGHGWPGSTTPGDSWRIRLWPSAGPGRPRRLREYVEPTTARPPAEFEEAGIAAVRRIHRDLDSEPPLSGKRGTVRVERRMPGTRRKLFKYFRDPSGWLTQSGGGSETSFGLSGGDYDDDGFGDANRIVACNGAIECAIQQIQPPEWVVASWTWERLPPDRLAAERRDGRPGAVLVPPDPQVTLRFDLEKAPHVDEMPATMVRVTHDHVPVEWVDDLSAYWRWMLERADYDFDLSDARRDRAATGH
jgi:hypothetical protein